VGGVVPVDQVEVGVGDESHRVAQIVAGVHDASRLAQLQQRLVQAATGLREGAQSRKHAAESILAEPKDARAATLGQGGTSTERTHGTGRRRAAAEDAQKLPSADTGHVVLLSVISCGTVCGSPDGRQERCHTRCQEPDARKWSKA
jgi:hypothetical protein